jgi:hypothetical protein
MQPDNSGTMISIIITWRDRKELAHTLPKFIEIASALQGDVTVVNFGGSLPNLLAQIKGYETKCLQLVNISGQLYFNKCCAQNIGVHHTSMPILFFCDCDVLVDIATISDLAGLVADNQATFATLAKVKETNPGSNTCGHVVSTGYELHIKTADGREMHLAYVSEDLETGMRMSPGLLITKRSDFFTVRGYNSQFRGWGWESQDIISRLILFAGLKRINQGSALHLSHDEVSRVKYSPVADRWENRDRMFRQSIENYNKGDFHGTYFSDIRETRAELISMLSGQNK